MARFMTGRAWGGSFLRPGRIFLVCLLLAAWSIGAPSRAEDTDVSSAESLVESAVSSEIAGDLAGRSEALRDAVQAEPDNHLARWHLGQIEVDGKWQPVEEAQQAAAADPRLVEYSVLRTTYGDRPEAQLALARWCQEQGLEEEARFHWASVLAIQPTHEEAQQALDLCWFRGQLLNRDELERAKNEARETQRAERHWEARLAGWRRDLSGELSMRMAALNEIRSVDDPQAISPLEEVTIGGDVSNDIQIARCRQLSMAFLDALAAMPDHAATESLVRHAVFAPLPSIRTAATDRLKERSLHDYVPLLLDGLASPVESSFRVVTGADGSVHYSHSLYREGRLADWSADRLWTAWQHDMDRRYTRVTPEGIVVAEPHRKVESDLSVARKQAAVAGKRQGKFGQTAQLLEEQIAQANQAAAELNERIIPVLVSVTGEDPGNQPSQWWDWWQDRNEYYAPDETPTYQVRDYRSDHRYYRPPQYWYEPPPQPPRRTSCFARGTLVWTKTGQRPIESLRLGDMVLSQDVDTGELAYTPVIRTTVRPPSPIVKLKIGKEEIGTTLGHPFWVAGKGWQMAKELSDGAVLHAVKEPTRISSSEPAAEAEAYNLVVAEFNTYFVGENGILVHDNTPRRPTRATVPGWAEK